MLTLHLSVDGVDTVIAKIENYKNKLNSLMTEFCRRVAEEGVMQAELGYNTVSTKGDMMPTVSYAPYGNGFVVTAQGEDVCFIEFGTGVDATHPKGSQFGMVADSWSVNHSQKYHKYGYWFYGGEMLNGTTAYMCMYNASVKMRNSLQRIANEVFSNV